MNTLNLNKSGQTLTSPEGVSQSMIMTVQRCPRLFQYQYLDKLETGKPQSAAMEFGTALHTSINSILEGDTDPMLTFRLHWDSIKNKEYAYARNSWDDYNKLAEVYLTRFERLHASKFKLFMCEERLKGTVHDSMGDSYSVEGTPDFIGTYDNIPCVIDFKTSSKAYDKIKIQTHPQLYLYAHLAQYFSSWKETPTHIGYVVFVSHPEPRIQTIFEEINPHIMHNMLTVCGDYARVINTRGVFPRNNNGCVSPYMCDYINQCWTRTDNAQFSGKSKSRAEVRESVSKIS